MSGNLEYQHQNLLAGIKEKTYLLNNHVVSKQKCIDYTEKNDNKQNNYGVSKQKCIDCIEEWP